MKCRHCNTTLKIVFADLGQAPPSNAYLRFEDLNKTEEVLPLRVMTCHNCWLVQTEDFISAEALFSPGYAYFSSFSTSWLDHCRRYVDQVVSQYRLNDKSLMLEIAANDGYLLQYVQQAGIPCIGIEPTESTAQAARDKGIEIYQDFFGMELARKIKADGNKADLIVANNVLAHIPKINDFLSGTAHLLKPDGVATFEFPHLCELVKYKQFDTIYHEHFSYLSLTALIKIFQTNGLEIFDAEKLSTHGGSLRVHSKLADNESLLITPNVSKLQQEETDLLVGNADYYSGFQGEIDRISQDLLAFISSTQLEQKSVCAYGAAAKGNTLLNYSGVDSNQIKFVADRNPSKQGLYLPGSHIPIVDEQELIKEKPDFIIIFPWNLVTEISKQLSYTKDWGAKFVTVIPNLKVFD